MNAKEKAKQLFDKYNQIKHSVSIPLNKKRVKQCALIAVDELLNSTFSQLFYIDILEDIVEDNYANDFWQEVKKEIEKL